MRNLLTLGLMALTAPIAALAEPLKESGYVVGCDQEGSPLACYIASRGYNLAVMQNAGTPPDLFAQMQKMDVPTAVTFEGEMTETGSDYSADLVLKKLTPNPDDLYEGNLQFMQGKWAPVGEETPFFIEINGLDWMEFVGEEPQAGFFMTVAEACASGVLPGNGMAISLYRYGDDPADDGCWRLEFIDETKMELRDFKGDQGAVSFARVK